MFLRGTVSGLSQSAPNLITVTFRPVVLMEGAAGEAVSRDDMFLILSPANAAKYEFGKSYDFAVPETPVAE